MALATEGALSDLAYQQENPGLPPDMGWQGSATGRSSAERASGRQGKGQLERGVTLNETESLGFLQPDRSCQTSAENEMGT